MKNIEFKKKELWHQYYNRVACGTDAHKVWFNRIFDAAYELGKVSNSENNIPQGMPEVAKGMKAAAGLADILKDIYPSEKKMLG